jgi:sulfite exporter TauE/SafE
MDPWPPLILGLLGSLHCAGMCGPLVLALPSPSASPLSFAAGRLAHNLGRLTTYCLLGALFGAFGKTLALAGLQRWASIAAGAAILIGVFGSGRLGLVKPAVQAVTRLKVLLASLLKRPGFGSLYLIGLLNGLLPCGLVYVACAAAVATGGFLTGLAAMALFGLGTTPMMFGIGLVGGTVSQVVRLRFQKLLPIGLGLIALLLILRGLSLGIPYISPNLSGGAAASRSCH